jgi:hypothetical protein
VFVQLGNTEIHLVQTKIEDGVTIFAQLGFVRLLPPVCFVHFVANRAGNLAVFVQLGNSPLQQCCQDGRPLK